jgi:NAD(P)-dependent dehydrogenase (short-subunit alcohol dehydrogenase family)
VALTSEVANGSARRVALVTGASSGIGREAARALAAKGWRIIGTGRDETRMAEAAAAITADSKYREVTLLRADLSLMGDAVRLAGTIGDLTDRLDLLINNAGGITDQLIMTPEGLEAMSIASGARARSWSTPGYEAEPSRTAKCPSSQTMPLDY